jgi:hypothetical protein
VSTAAAWTGAIGTWAVGVAAASITAVQLYRAGFRPRFTAFRDDLQRIVITLTNRGSRQGTVIDINLINRHDPEVAYLEYDWEIAGHIVPWIPLPFELEGGSTVLIVIRPQRPMDITRATRVQLEYGSQKSRCLPIVPIHHYAYATTSVPMTPLPSTSRSAPTNILRASLSRVDTETVELKLVNAGSTDLSDMQVQLAPLSERASTADVLGFISVPASNPQDFAYLGPLARGQAATASLRLRPNSDLPTYLPLSCHCATPSLLWSRIDLIAAPSHPSDDGSNDAPGPS